MAHDLWLRIADVTVAIQSDSKPVRDALAWIYDRFIVPVGTSGAADITYRIMAAGDGRCAVPGLAVRADGRTYPVRDAETAACYVNSILFGCLAARVQSHWLLHGGAVVTPRSGGGIIFSGPPGCGKTTLVVAMLQSGGGFLSDEVAAISRSSGRLEPFPRAVGVRAGGLRLLGDLPVTQSLRLLDFDREEIFFFPAEKVAAAGLAESCPVRAVFLLRAGSGEREGMKAKSVADYIVQVVVDQASDAWQMALRCLLPTTEVQVQPFVGCDVVGLEPPVAGGCLTDVEALCREHGVVLLNTFTALDAPAFESAPRLERLPASEGLLQLSQALMNRGATLGQTLAGLAAAVGGSRFYRLQVGSLPRTVELVWDVMRET
jgi:DNA polymerase III delta prime subunit